MKRYPEFIYNAIDNQSIVYTNQLKMSDWNNIINVLRTQANANTTFLETWTRWFFGPKEYIEEDEYVTIPEGYTNYFDYLTGMFTEIDTRIVALYNYVDAKHNASLNAVTQESSTRASEDTRIISEMQQYVNTQVAEEAHTRQTEYDSITTKLNELAQDVEDEADTRYKQDDSLSKRISKVDESIDTLSQRVKDLENTGITEEAVEALKKVEGELDNIRSTLSTLSNTVNNLGTDLTGKYTDLEKAVGYIQESVYDLQEYVDELSSTIITPEVIESLQNNMHLLQQSIATLTENLSVTATKASDAYILAEKKLDKIFSGLSNANSLADNDYFVINSNNAAYKVPFSMLKNLMGADEPQYNPYIGDFESLDALNKYLTDNSVTPQEGDYAYIKDTNGLYEMYLYINNAWSSSAGGKYVLTTTFDNFKNQLSGGSYEVKHAQGYKTDTGETILFKEKLSSITSDITNVTTKIKYTNSTPTTKELGGIPKGTTFSNKSITDVLDMLLYPYVAFSCSVSATPTNGGIFKKGTTKTITGCTVSITKGSAQITKIVIKYNRAVYATITDNITTSNTYTLLSPISITSSSPDTQLSVVVTDSTGASKTATSTSFTFVNPYYYGVTTKDANSINASDVLAMTESVVTKSNKTYSYAMTKQRAVIAYPASYGALKGIKDKNNFEVLNTFNQISLTINNESYQVYILNDLNTASMTYTFSY